ncbi:peptidylprolyl isomerase [Paenibacillus shenyangensis]|uniref:peptidylprolyl isomerase n=1 Tax=Paenibacillus sp. A9 TaxID=1284352 RepID=UPI00037B5BCD|nr:peptidylprolyl isomerase [Paenibacillus sp. A9]
MWPIKKAARKTAVLTAGAVLSISLLAACNNGNNAAAPQQPKAAEQAKDSSPVVAEYEGGTITENEFNKEVSMQKFLTPQYAQMFDMPEYREQIMNKLLDQEVAYKSLAQNASEAAKTEGAKQADEQIKQFKASMAPEQWEEMLKAASLKEQDVKDYMTLVLTGSEVMKEKVTDDKVQSYFDANKKDYTTATVRHVLIGLQSADGKTTRTDAQALKLAKEVKAKLDKGADFATIAKKYTDDTGSKEQGGQYKDQKVGNWVEGFKNAVLTQKIGVVGPPVKTDYGYHVIKVESRTEKEFKDLTAEEKDTIKSQLASQNFSNYMANDVPKMIKSKNLPKAPAPAATEGAGDATGGATSTPGTTESPGTAGDASTGKSTTESGAKSTETAPAESTTESSK